MFGCFLGLFIKKYIIIIITDKKNMIGRILAKYKIMIEVFWKKITRKCHKI